MTKASSEAGERTKPRARAAPKTGAAPRAPLIGPAVILVAPQLGENIGFAARAMANFGLSELRLVAPRDGWPSEKARAAFDINAEDPKARDAYGRNPAGQRLLMARRLVESGVRFVTLTYGGWDLHGSIAAGTRSQLPQFDQAFAALIKDLEVRGLLDSTLIMISSEFGRTPKINPSAGRDHWNFCYGLLLAGGGIKAGTVYGASDRIGARPSLNPVLPGDVIATIYHCLGLPNDFELRDRLNRPFQLVPWGSPIRELIA